jgi:ubiquinone/menaquinone biosynthesis C-methylase UbiE
MLDEEGKDTMSDNTYVFDPEDTTEMARLIHQDRMLTQGMGGPLTGLPELSDTAQVLDLCCGPGGWVLDTAFAHPEMEVAGIDISEIMIAYANARARSQQLPNASFGVMNILEPLDFSDNSFDLVNARFIAAVLHRDRWLDVVRECYRITKPGGLIRFTETDVVLSSSLAFSELMHQTYQMGKALGYGFSPDGRSYGITHMLGGFLRTVGCENIQSRMHMVDFSADSEAWADFFHNFDIGFRMVQPKLVKAGMAAQEELERLHQQFLIDLHHGTFRGIWPYMSAWGTKPLVDC